MDLRLLPKALWPLSKSFTHILICGAHSNNFVTIWLCLQNSLRIRRRIQIWCKPVTCHSNIRNSHIAKTSTITHLDAQLLTNEQNNKSEKFLTAEQLIIYGWSNMFIIFVLPWCICEISISSEYDLWPSFHVLSFGDLHSELHFKNSVRNVERIPGSTKIKPLSIFSLIVSSYQYIHSQFSLHTMH